MKRERLRGSQRGEGEMEGRVREGRGKDRGVRRRNGGALATKTFRVCPESQVETEAPLDSPGRRVFIPQLGLDHLEPRTKAGFTRLPDQLRLLNLVSLPGSPCLTLWSYLRPSPTCDLTIPLKSLQGSFILDGSEMCVCITKVSQQQTGPFHPL